MFEPSLAKPNGDKHLFFKMLIRELYLVLRLVLCACLEVQTTYNRDKGTVLKGNDV